MSVMRCDGCDGMIDTDFVCEGVWEDASPFRYWCPRCSEDANNTEMLAALKIQDPDVYQELTEQC